MLQEMTIEDTIKKLENDWAQAIIKKNKSRCKELLSDQFMLLSARGLILSKEQWLEELVGITIKTDEFIWKNYIIKCFENIVTVNGVIYHKATRNEEEWSGEFLVTDVWLFENEVWRVISRQGTGPFTHILFNE